MPAVARFEREPIVNITTEVINFGKEIDRLRFKRYMVGFFKPSDLAAAELGEQPLSWEQHTGEQSGVKLCYDPGSRTVSVSTAQLIGLSSVDFRVFVPRRSEDDPTRGSMYGWHYFNRRGEIGKVTEIPVEELRGEDRIVLAHTNRGRVSIVDDEAYNIYNAPGNLEALGASIASFSMQLEKLEASIK